MADSLPVQPYLTAVKDSIVILGAIVGALWFLYTRQHKRRVSFQIEASPMPLLPLPRHRGLELRFVFTNEGDRQQDVVRVVFQLDAIGPPVAEGVTRAAPSGSGWRRLGFFTLEPRPGGKVPRVRPGTQHILAELVAIPSDITIVRVTARLDYFRAEALAADAELDYPAHSTIRRHLTLLPPITSPTDAA